ncbi:hypothetical protein BDN72DRAFT_860924, partial [Pluteus cervinus]
STCIIHAPRKAINHLRSLNNRVFDLSVDRCTYKDESGCYKRLTTTVVVAAAVRNSSNSKTRRLPHKYPEQARGVDTIGGGACDHNEGGSGGIGWVWRCDGAADNNNDGERGAGAGDREELQGLPALAPYEIERIVDIVGVDIENVGWTVVEVAVAVVEEKFVGNMFEVRRLWDTDFLRVYTGKTCMLGLIAVEEVESTRVVNVLPLPVVVVVVTVMAQV